MFHGTSDPSASYIDIRTDDSNDQHDTPWSLQSYGTNNMVWEQITAQYHQCFVDHPATVESLITDLDLHLQDEIPYDYLSAASLPPLHSSPSAPNVEMPIFSMNLEETAVLPWAGDTLDPFSSSAILNDFTANLDANSSSFATSQQDSFGAGLQQEFGFANADFAPSVVGHSINTMNITHATDNTTVPSTMFRPNESGSHSCNVDHDSRYQRRIMEDTPLCASPVACVAPLPDHTLTSGPTSELFRGGNVPSTVDSHRLGTLSPLLIQSVPPPILTSWPGHNRGGLLQLAPRLASSGLTPLERSLVPRGKRKVSRGSHKIPATTRAPSTRKAFSCSDLQARAPDHLSEKICGWRGTDGSICGERVSRKTVPKHLVVHGITKLSYNMPVICRWCPDGSVPMKRESIVRHFREVHLRLQRANTII
ncbi:hypothetical protein BU15DRAFT_81500 [Melanogaster broomeanus]|nr:hypothetical protein BU15DRAFT_81500 [Melanogaster broomeanus]